MSEIVGRLLAKCSGWPYAKISWPHRLLHDAVAEIKRLEASNLNKALVQLTKEHEEMRNYALDVTRALTGLVGGGSEMFAGRVGEMFKADIPFCVQRVRERFDRAEARARDAIRARKNAEIGQAEPPSYHDLYVTTASIPRQRLFDLPYSYRVTCFRTAGWELWESPGRCIGRDDKLVAGEYGPKGLRLDINGVVICNSLLQKEEGDGDCGEAADGGDVR